jgi:uncharacterized protein YjdB
MKFMKIAITLLSLLFLMSGCESKSSSKSKTVEKINSTLTIEGDDIVNIGTAQKLLLVNLSDDGKRETVDSDVLWSSSDNIVATIDKNGNFVALSAGSVTIIANYKQEQATFIITINPITVVSISIVQDNFTLAIGSTQQFILSATYSDNSAQSVLENINWSSKDSTVVAISESGLLTAVGVGTTSITASYEGKISSREVNVVADSSEIEVQSLSINGSSSVVIKGNSLTLSLTGHLADSSTSTVDSGIIWSSSNENIATINENGMITTVGTGEVAFTANVNGLSTTVTLTVNANEEIMVLNQAYTVNTGDEVLKTTEDTVLKVLRKLNPASTTVTLTKGAAKIIHP